MKALLTEEKNFNLVKPLLSNRHNYWGKLLKFHETPYFSTLSDFLPIGCKSPKKATQIPVWSQYHTEAWEEQLGSEDEGAGKHLSG